MALDAQGLTRSVVKGAVEPNPAPACGDFLRGVDILQADDSEILIFTGAADAARAAEVTRAAGAEVVLVTRASQGSEVYAAAGALYLDAVVPRELADVTGCGDTYLAAFLGERIRGKGLEHCAGFATVAASLNIETRGPFRGTRDDVLRRWAEVRHGSDGEPGLMSPFSKI